MNVTVETIEKAMSRMIGDYVLFTGAGGAEAGATVTTTDTEVLSRPGQYWVPYILHPVTGTANNVDKYREISDFTVSGTTGTFTPVNAFPAQAVASDTFRIHRWPVTWKYEAISDALREMGGILPRIIVEDFLTGEMLRNNNLEQWSNNVPYDWETISGTVTRETSTKYHGASSLKIIGASSSVRQRIALEREMNGYTLAITGYVNGKIANAPKLRLTVGATNNDSSTVAADDTWEQLSKTVSIADWTQPVYVSLINNHASEAAYYDALHLTLRDAAGNDLTQTHYIPISNAFRSVRQVWLRRSTTTTFSQYPFDTGTRIGLTNVFDGYARFDGWLTTKYPIRIVGVGTWPEVSASTDTVDIELQQVPLVANRAGQELMRKGIRHEHLGDSARWEKTLNDLKEEETDLVRRLSRPGPTKLLALPMTR